MAVLAAPLVIPFAEALGLSVAILGMDKVSDKVNQFIQDNPEESMKIFQMIMPAQGIANALKNKSSEDVEEVEETEEVTTGSGVEERIREILREAGVEDADNQDLTDLPKDLEAKVMSGIAKSSTNKQEDMKEASLIIGLRGPGKEKKEMIDDVAERYDEGGIEEITKPKYEGYKKFIRRRKADGGSIGIEVLFEPKRKDFNIGGNVQRVTTPQPYDARASTADFARAIDRVGAGTDMQKAMAIQDYGQNVQRQNMLGKIKDAGTNLAMQAYGLNPTKAGIAQDPSMLEFQEIKTAGLPQKDYSAASTYGMLEDMTEGNPITRALAGTAGLVALPANEVLRPAYDLMQGVYKGITDPNKSIPQAIKDEKIPEMLAGSREGVLQFIGDQFGLTNNRQDIVDSITKTPTYDSASAGAIITDGDSKYRINADGSRSLIGKIEDAPLNAPLNRDDFNKFFSTGNSKDYESYLSNFSKEQKVADKNNQLYYGPNQRPTMADVAGPATQGLIPGFTKLENTANLADGDVAYQGPDGQIYGPETYGSIAAGMYPNIYDPNKQTLADGGRVGLFMGGDPLTGQALAIYNSMNAYGFSDAEIADALRARGLYDAAPVVETPVTNTQTNIINQNRGGDGPTAPPGPTGPGFFSDLNKDDYEAEAYNVGPTFAGTFARGRIGIQNLISKLRSLPTPLNIALNVIDNIKNPYTNPLGNLNRATKEAINREEVRDLQDRMDKGQFGSTTPTPQDARRGGQYDGGGRGKGGGGDPYGGGPGGLHAKDGGLVTMFKEKR